METSFSHSILARGDDLRRSRLSVRLHRKDASNPLSVSTYREKLYPISVSFCLRLADEDALRASAEFNQSCPN